MRAFQIQDTKEFMKKLLLSEAFDALCVSEAAITTFCTFTVNGAYHPEYFDPADQISSENVSLFSPWKRIRPFFLELTKGSHTPLSFHIVFRFSPAQTQKWLIQNGLKQTPEDVDGLFLTVRFADKTLSVTSGTSLKTFTLDRTLEHTWDASAESFLRKMAVPFL